ncbi:hypothetical protein [Alienimonas sp. DA493]|uniref:hypothetical protein n=1 Tax=Alienimonas sp. DA493 TaxID=3373605 RepID=UPI003753EDF8
MPPPPQLPGPDEIPAESSVPPPEGAAEPTSGCAALALAAIAGGTLTAAGLLAAILYAEANRPPAPGAVSYGQAVVLISLPLVILWGAAVGAGAGLFAAGERWVGAGVQLLAAATGTLAFHRLRAADVARNGPDVSQTVLYDAPVAVGLAVGVLAAAVCVGAAVVRRARR